MTPFDEFSFGVVAMFDAGSVAVGAITETSERRITGWVRADQVEYLKPLKLMIGDRLVDLHASYTHPTNIDEHPLQVVEFCFEDPELLSKSRLFTASVLTCEGWRLPPSPVLVDVSDSVKSKHWSLQAIDSAVVRILDSQMTVHELSTSVALLASWFGHAIDRMNALRDIDTGRTNALSELIKSPRSFGGALQHLLGVIATRYEPTSIPACSEPEVSIIIPVHNKFELTYDCIRSIVQSTRTPAYEIVVVDDCSSDETLLAKVIFDGPLRIVRTERNLGFVGACNAGAAAARGRYLLFLNNDTLIRDDVWLREMVETFSRFDRVGIVGARLVFGDGVLQECGGIVWNDGSAWNYGRYQSIDDWKYRFARDADYVSGACLMIERQFFDELGNFDTIFAPAYYEDTDICFRTRAAGRRVVVQPGATITHLEGQSNGVDTSAGLKRYQVRNQGKFLHRWAGTLAEHQPNGIDLPKALARFAKGTLLFIDDSMLTPDRDAGSNAALEHIRSLQRLGYNVTFVPADNMTDIKPYSLRLETQGVECIYAPHFWSLEDFLRRDHRDYDIIYIHRFSNADRYMHLCRRLRPAARIIYNVADLHSLREERAADLAKDGDVYGVTAVVAQRREFALIEEADATIVHSTAERDYLATKGVRADVHVVPWTIPLQSPASGYADRRDIAFIGGFRHAPNVDAVLWFFNNVFHPMLALDPSIKFKIIGSDMPAEFKLIDHSSVEAIGYVEDLASTMGGLRLTVAPLRFGAGVKGKVLTSMAFGVPCIMSSIAAEGIPLPRALESLVGDDPAAYARTIHHFYNDESAWCRAREAGQAFIADEFSETAVDRRMAKLL